MGLTDLKYATYAAVLFVGIAIGDSSSPARGQSVETNKPKSELQQLAQMQSSDPKLIKIGIKFARRKGCIACHSLDGKRKPGPTWKGLFGSQRKLNSGNVVVADEAYIRRSIFDPRAEVVKGYPRSLMPKGLRQKLTDEQVEAIIAVIKSIR